MPCLSTPNLRPQAQDCTEALGRRVQMGSPSIVCVSAFQVYDLFNVTRNTLNPGLYRHLKQVVLGLVPGLFHLPS